MSDPKTAAKPDEKAVAADNIVEVNMLDDSEDHGYILTWSDIHCTIETGGLLKPKRRVQALQGVSGFALPGEAIAILGASGAGKSTLMDILSKRKTFGDIKGSVLLNAREPDNFFEKRLGYVTYDMSHIATMTVRETLMFAAEMRMKASTTHEERVKMVETQIENLRLQTCADTCVGDELLRGLSSGERKRLEVAIELIAEPKIIFLDEPTSGLDDYGAKFTMELILNYARRLNITVLVVIHQPSKAVIELFNKVMILGAGRVSFFGPFAEAEAYFTSIGQPTPEHTNPIEHYVDVIAADPVACADTYAASDLAAKLTAELKRLEDPKNVNPVKPHSALVYERSFMDQLRLLTRRVCYRYQRNYSTSYGRIILSTVIILIYGLMFWKIDSNITGIRNRGSLASVMAFIPAFVAGSAAPQFLEDRDLYIQEMKSGFYQTGPYYLSYFIVEAVLIVLINLIQGTLLFFMAGIDSTTFAPFLFMILLQGLVSVGVTQWISSVSKNLVECFTFLVGYGLVMYAYSGVQANLEVLPTSLRWITYIDYWRYSVQFLLYRTIENVILQCGDATIPLDMNEVVAGLRAKVLDTVYNKTLAEPMNKTFQDNAALNMGAILALSSLNSSVIPALPVGKDAAAVKEISTAIQADEDFIAINALQYLSKDADIVQNLTLRSTIASQYGAVFLWNGTTHLNDTGVFPDYSFCPIIDAPTFIRVHFGIQSDSGDNNRFGIMFGWLLFFMLLSYIGLIRSKHFKKR
ncbi:hypothetical protein HK101_001255 [Irineochytrium annulatum]|nr:hypothetical protein HK101_001255 [Irineochytrium annulatum]